MNIVYQALIHSQRHKASAMVKSANVVIMPMAILAARALYSLIAVRPISSPISFVDVPLSPIADAVPTNASSNSSFDKDPISHQQYPSIGLGELPGYTGWARPSYTDAPLYEIESVTPAPHFAHDTITIIVHCLSPRCSTFFSALFYVRMYGPAILTGKVTSVSKGKYRIEFLPRDVGSYWIEVVLTFSKGEDIGNFPISESKAIPKSSDPSYEGHLLPGFPFAVDVTDDGLANSHTNRLCGADDLRIESLDDGLRVARWKVLDKVNSVHYGRSGNKVINLSGYQDGRNSLGIWADYQPTNCNLIQAPHRSIDECVSNRRAGKILHFVFVGDSVLRLQVEMMMPLVHTPSVKTTKIATHGGIIQTIHNVTSTLEELNFEQEDVVILFNSGLHDIGKFCRRRIAINSSGYLSDPSEYACIDEYQEKLADLVQFISTMPARVKIFQTTSAGWMKWGNYGPAWNPGVPHSFTTSPHVVDEFNNVALRVLDNYEGFDIVDGYWMSLARPDNRQVDQLQAVGKHLVHPGLEVLGAMGRVWMTLVLSRLGCEISVPEGSTVEHEFFRAKVMSI